MYKDHSNFLGLSKKKFSAEPRTISSLFNRISEIFSVLGILAGIEIPAPNKKAILLIFFIFILHTAIEQLNS